MGDFRSGGGPAVEEGLEAFGGGRVVGGSEVGVGGESSEGAGSGGVVDEEEENGWFSNPRVFLMREFEKERESLEVPEVKSCIISWTKSILGTSTTRGCCSSEGTHKCTIFSEILAMQVPFGVRYTPSASS